MVPKPIGQAESSGSFRAWSGSDCWGGGDTGVLSSAPSNPAHLEEACAEPSAGWADTPTPATPTIGKHYCVHGTFALRKHILEPQSEEQRQPHRGLCLLCVAPGAIQLKFLPEEPTFITFDQWLRESDKPPNCLSLGAPFLVAETRGQ